MVTIRLVSYLEKMAGFREKEIKIEEPTRVRDLIAFDLPDERLMVVVDDIGGDLDTVVDNDSRVVISPIFGGG